MNKHVIVLTLNVIVYILSLTTILNFYSSRGQSSFAQNTISTFESVNLKILMNR